MPTKSPLCSRSTDAQARFGRRFAAPFFKEFVVRDRSGQVAALLEDATASGILAGVALGRWYPKLDDCFLVAVTEKRSRQKSTAGSNCLVASRHWKSRRMRNRQATQLLFELSKPGRQAAELPVCDVPVDVVDCGLPADLLADSPPPLPELAEPDVVRHFTNLSTLNMSVDTHFYPLGSCTMKYNPKRNERLAGLPASPVASLSARSNRPRAAATVVRTAAGLGGDLGTSGRLFAAGGGCPWGVDRFDGGGRVLPSHNGQTTHQSPRPR